MDKVVQTPEAGRFVCTQSSAVCKTYFLLIYDSATESNIYLICRKKEWKRIWDHRKRFSKLVVSKISNWLWKQLYVNFCPEEWRGAEWGTIRADGWGYERHLKSLCFTRHWSDKVASHWTKQGKLTVNSTIVSGLGQCPLSLDQCGSFSHSSWPHVCSLLFSHSGVNVISCDMKKHVLCLSGPC